MQIIARDQLLTGYVQEIGLGRVCMLEVSLLAKEPQQEAENEHLALE